MTVVLLFHFIRKEFPVKETGALIRRYMMGNKENNKNSGKDNKNAKEEKREEQEKKETEAGIMLNL